MYDIIGTAFEVLKKYWNITPKKGNDVKTKKKDYYKTKSKQIQENKYVYFRRLKQY